MDTVEQDTIMIKTTILEVLARYANQQANLDSDVLQNMIADELQDELYHKYIISDKHDTYWEQGQPGVDY